MKFAFRVGLIADWVLHGMPSGCGTWDSRARCVGFVGTAQRGVCSPFSRRLAVGLAQWIKL